MSKQNKAGRPKFIPVIPKGAFTLKDLCEANGVDVSGTPKTNKNYGKGEQCIRLTLVKWVDRETGNRRSGKVRLLDEKRKPTGNLGAPQYLYSARNPDDVGVAAAKAARAEAEAARNVTPEATPARKVGRKPKVAKVAKAKRKYTRRAKTATPETASQTPTADALDKIKAALAAPEVPVNTPITAPVTVPVAEITPAPSPVVAETPAPAPVPVAAETVTPAPETSVPVVS